MTIAAQPTRELRPYIRLKVTNLGQSLGEKWVAGKDGEGFVLTDDRKRAEVYTEVDAFSFRKVIISRLPEQANVVFDL